ncbi:MAG: aldehyde dehydrogenase [Bacteroidetes bacterium GWF2_49_14]|nr:MAG: aldehyde dehydrogenase [Bacteroidetes bacterium GWF2_49_14]
MEDTSAQTIRETLNSQRAFFATNQTKNLNFRLEQLRRFKAAIKKFEKPITVALWKDLHKSAEEAYLTEISMVMQDLDNHIRHLKRWAKPKRVPTPFHLLPSRSRIYYEPLGVALVLAAWNYPFQLLMNPLIGAISSGCCAMLKPSPYTPHVAGVMEELIRDTFRPDYVSLVQGSRKVNAILLEQRFDFIFYTGSPAVGKVVMRAAAESLTPLVLELGGKSPCIVDREANLEIAAKKIAWGKTINAGQTCIAPDYLFVHRSVKEELLVKIIAHFDRTYGQDVHKSPWYPRIVSHSALERLQKLLLHGTIIYGGRVEHADRYMAPTIIDDIQPDFPIMQEEIFGPILPVLTFDRIEEVYSFVNSREKPLALYYFGNPSRGREVLDHTTSGGGCINDVLLHIANHNLPYGGIGNSGLGHYHGHHSFLAFSNSRSYVLSPTWFDLPVKYVPFKGFRWVKKII